ncbi:MAG: hypothetical protein L0287_19120, partial [Anaerolineae bacterium]|nr:hypothetical protein [Anaerolineae bacterium]
FVRVFYSQFMNRYYNAFFSQYYSEIYKTDQMAGSPNFGSTTLDVDDGTEFRSGVEYIAYLRNIPFSIRGGYWREPFHSIRQNLDDSELERILNQNLDQLNDTNTAPFYSNSQHRDTTHITFGTGIILGSRVSIDWAYDYSSKFSSFVISTAFYPGRKS